MSVRSLTASDADRQKQDRTKLFEPLGTADSMFDLRPLAATKDRAFQHWVNEAEEDKRPPLLYPHDRLRRVLLHYRGYDERPTVPSQQGPAGPG
ncbi:MAG: hypothetical protein JW843_04170 [Candidatus Aminicenantes bacterium]|nr:hypothetical protein [Candidatus Aminicenantes bacterium]